MLEKTARQKRCCGPEDCGWRCPNDDERYCITDECMAWQWDTLTMSFNEVEKEEGWFSNAIFKEVPLPRDEWEGDCFLLRKRVGD